MDFIIQVLTDWLKEILVGGIMGNLTGMFDAVNQKVGEVSEQVGLTPQAWNGDIFSMIQNLSETVMVPIAGVILAFVMTLELIQLIVDAQIPVNWLPFKLPSKIQGTKLPSERRGKYFVILNMYG